MIEPDVKSWGQKYRECLLPRAEYGTGTVPYIGVGMFIMIIYEDCLFKKELLLLTSRKYKQHEANTPPYRQSEDPDPVLFV